MLIVRPLDVGQPLQQPALRDFHGPYSNNYPGRYLSVHRIRSKYLSITLDPGHYFSKHWMRVLPIAESPRGGFIPFIKKDQIAFQNLRPNLSPNLRPHQLSCFKIHFKTILKPIINVNY